MINNSTVRLEATIELPNYNTPYSVGGTTSSSATVAVLKYNEKIYLVTNAHAVQNATYLKVKLNHFSQEIPVQSCWIDPVLDLAILQTTNDESKDFLLKHLNALPISPEFQKQGTEVFAYGYPAGGRSLSFTKGHISRVELSMMCLSKQFAITVQTSAPINPGNSGGPITCLKDKQEICIGIVAQGNPSLQNTGYFIPASSVLDTIERYEKWKKLKKIKAIDFITAPMVSFNWQPLKNNILRESIGLPKLSLDDEPTGILISDVSENSCAYPFLKAGDIVQSIDGFSVQSNGEIKVPELEHPISFLFAILRKNYLDNIVFNILRKNNQGQLESIDIPIRLSQQLGQSIVSPDYQSPLKYHIQPAGEKGAFVFIRYTKSFRNGFQGNNNLPPFFSEFPRINRMEAREVVILQNIITSVETDGYNQFPVTSGAFCISHRVVEANGIKITCLYDLVSALSDTSKISEVKFDNGRVLYIASSNKDTLDNLKKSHHIRFFRSHELSKLDLQDVITELNNLGARDDNHHEHLKKVETKCLVDCFVDSLFSEKKIESTEKLDDHSMVCNNNSQDQDITESTLLKRLPN